MVVFVYDKGEENKVCYWNNVIFLYKRRDLANCFRTKKTWVWSSSTGLRMMRRC